MNEFFESNQLSTHANASMVFKTVVLILLYVTPFVFIYTGAVQTVLQLIICYLVVSLGKSGIGMGVMHDANHGSYSKNKTVNKYLGLTLNFIGANATVWKLQHNVLHHTYTNIYGADEDLNTTKLLRFSPHSELKSYHRYQHIYAWFLYAISTLSWMTAKDFVRLAKFREMGLVKTSAEFNKILMQVILWKLFYFSYALVIPMLIVPFSAWYVLLAFVIMHFVTGLALSVIFQTAHVVPVVDFPKPESDGSVEQDWYVHQLATTANFAPKSRILSWFIGGLNFQIEHHLLPKVCHIHYKKLSPIVQQTAAEFNLPYLTRKNFVTAVADHYRMLRLLGK